MFKLINVHNTFLLNDKQIKAYCTGQERDYMGEPMTLILGRISISKQTDQICMFWDFKAKMDHTNEKCQK